MFCVSDEAASAIRTAYLDKGEWPAVAELRRFYRIDDNAAALTCARTIASWEPIDTAAMKSEIKRLRRTRRQE
ncbi:MAG: hypothetical protein WCJ64_05065 [Rhodospirillaceae bacterium]